MANRIANLTIDCRDATLLANFWCRILGWQVTARNGDDVTIAGDAAPFRIDFMQLPAVGRRKARSRMHLDVVAIDTDQETELARLLANGARAVTLGEGEVSWHVLADPEGNEFCLVREEVPAPVAVRGLFAPRVKPAVSEDDAAVAMKPADAVVPVEPMVAPEPVDAVVPTEPTVAPLVVHGLVGDVEPVAYEPVLDLSVDHEVHASDERDEADLEVDLAFEPEPSESEPSGPEPSESEPSESGPEPSESGPEPSGPEPSEPEPEPSEPEPEPSGPEPSESEPSGPEPAADEVPDPRASLHTDSVNQLREMIRARMKKIN